MYLGMFIACVCVYIYIYIHICLFICIMYMNTYIYISTQYTIYMQSVIYVYATGLRYLWHNNHNIIFNLYSTPQNIWSAALNGSKVMTASGFAATALSRKHVACNQVLCSCTHAAREGCITTTRPQLGTKHFWAPGPLSQLRTSSTSSGSPVNHSVVQKDEQQWWSSHKTWTKKGVWRPESRLCRDDPALHTFNASRCFGPRARKCCW